MAGRIRQWLQNKVFYTAWLLLHIVYLLQLQLRDYLSFNLKYVRRRLLSCLPLYGQEGDIARFVESVSKLHKVPKHLAISVLPDHANKSILSTLLQKLWAITTTTPEGAGKKTDDGDSKLEPGEINLQALARVVAWASAANISVISLYDYHGKD